MIYLILYIKIGLILSVVYTMMISYSEQEITLTDLVVVIFLYPILIYYLITEDF
jgi:hypothetical protein